MDRHDALASALGVAHAEQAPLEVDVVPVEPEQLAAAQAGEGEQGEQQPVALGSPAYTLPHALAPGHLEQACQLGAVEHVGQRFALLGGA